MVLVMIDKYFALFLKFYFYYCLRIDVTLLHFFFLFLFLFCFVFLHRVEKLELLINLKKCAGVIQMQS